MRAVVAGAPEDWSGSVDVNVEDLPDARRPAMRDWQCELEQLDADHIQITEFE